MGGKDTRWRIVEAAMELFWLKGYASTSIADILSRSQVNSGSLYYFFPGKQDVLLAVLEAYRDGIGAMLLEPAWSGVEDPVEKVFALLGAVSPRDRRYGMPVRLSDRQPRAGASRCGPGRPRAAGGEFHRLGRCGGGMLPRRRAPFREGTDFRGLAELALNVMEGGVMQARTYRDVAHFDRAVAQFRIAVDAMRLRETAA